MDICNILSTFSWNFVDLFLILISIALTDQFRQLNSRLNSIRGKVSDSKYSPIQYNQVFHR